jgi:hypothetical protein
MEHWWNDNDRENWSMWIKHVSVPLCPPQVPCVIAWDWTWPTWWQAVNYLCHGTAVKILITVWVCPVVITCHLLHCSCVWLSQYKCPTMNKLCTHPILHYPCEVPKQPHCCYILTSDQYSQTAVQTLDQLEAPLLPQNLKTQTVPLQITNVQ